MSSQPTTTTPLLNCYFDNIYVINLKRRQDRLAQFKSRIEQVVPGLKYEVFTAVDGLHPVTRNALSIDAQGRNGSVNSSEFGCTLSHYAAITDAKCRGYKKILILEDDALPVKSLATHNFSSMDADWKLFYLGGTQHPSTHKRLNQWRAPDGSLSGYHAFKTRGTFAYGISHHIYDQVLKLIEGHGSVEPIDSILGKIQNTHFCPVIFPYLFISDVSDSDIRNERNMENFSSQNRWIPGNYVI